MCTLDPEVKRGIKVAPELDTLVLILPKGRCGVQDASKGWCSDATGRVECSIWSERARRLVAIEVCSSWCNICLEEAEGVVGDVDGLAVCITDLKSESLWILTMSCIGIVITHSWDEAFGFVGEARGLEMH